MISPGIRRIANHPTVPNESISKVKLDSPADQLSNASAESTSSLDDR